MVERFLETHDIRQALDVQKLFELPDFGVSRALALYHYKNKNETEQLIIEEKVGVRIIIKIPLTPTLSKWIVKRVFFSQILNPLS